ncbi:MAG: helix-turn-helix transcriptional regulator [Clostridia bacterium]|nr:helix-turn-helix transcriptional regulator [Clostridia bacterium]
MEFTKILKDLMKINDNLTQTELAKKIGLKPSQVCEWLKGKSKPGYDSLKALAIALNVSADVLLGITDI